MKTSIKTFACAAVVSILLFACDDTSTNNAEPSGPTSPSLNNHNKMPVMDSRVVSYQRKGCSTGFTDDDELLKSCFPHIFNNGQAKSECNYFALSFIGSSLGWDRSYMILSEDMTLYGIRCTLREPPGGDTGDFDYVTMLVCDDKNGTLRKSINHSIQFYWVPDWECESGIGEPNWKEIYF
jgi:hypothetical protein